MEITLDIPDELASNFGGSEESLSRIALEAMATEGYRDKKLTESEVRRLLGFNTRMEVHAFLKKRGAYLHYSEADLENDRLSALRMKEKRQQRFA